MTTSSVDSILNLSFLPFGYVDDAHLAYLRLVEIYFFIVWCHQLDRTPDDAEARFTQLLVIHSVHSQLVEFSVVPYTGDGVVRIRPAVRASNGGPNHAGELNSSPQQQICGADQGQNVSGLHRYLDSLIQEKEG